MEFIIGILGIALQGLALKILWIWFAVPTFNLPVISIPQALGISLIMSLMTHQNRKTLDTAQEVTYVILTPIFAIVTGFVLKTHDVRERGF